MPPRPVFVVTGTSGAGKGTIERELLARMPELELAISATTRPRREGEANGREYWFISDEEFDRKLAAREFLEHIVFDWGQRSGTLRSEIDRILDAGRIPLLDLETEGALALAETVPTTVTIFVKAPSFEENERRLRDRATESEGEIEERLELARRQLEQEDLFDHVIVNDHLDRSVEELEAIVRGALQSAGTVSRP
ncbi:MAG TPA: guanylate kinase [Gaiellaceae bacterium]|nr:guanylate kinase [Gaiellaceae bacterium]